MSPEPVRKWQGALRRAAHPHHPQEPSFLFLPPCAPSSTTTPLAHEHIQPSKMAENWLRKTSELLPLRFASWVVSEEVRPLPKPAQSQQQETPRSRRGNCPGRARGTGSPPRQQESGADRLRAFRDPLSGDEERGTASSTLGPSSDFLLHARAALARASTLPALLGRCLHAPDSEVTRRSRTPPRLLYVFPRELAEGGCFPSCWAGGGLSTFPAISRASQGLAFFYFQIPSRRKACLLLSPVLL